MIFWMFCVSLICFSLPPSLVLSPSPSLSLSLSFSLPLSFSLVLSLFSLPLKYIILETLRCNLLPTDYVLLYLHNVISSVEDTMSLLQPTSKPVELCRNYDMSCTCMSYLWHLNIRSVLIFKLLNYSNCFLNKNLLYSKGDLLTRSRESNIVK